MAAQFLSTARDNDGNEGDRQFEIDISVYPERVRKTDPIIVFGDVSTRTCKDELAANGQTPGFSSNDPMLYGVDRLLSLTIISNYYLCCFWKCEETLLTKVIQQI